MYTSYIYTIETWALVFGPHPSPEAALGRPSITQTYICIRDNGAVSRTRIVRMGGKKKNRKVERKKKKNNPESKGGK